MLLDTARFGRLTWDAGDLLLFPEGLIGFEHLHAWVLLREQPLNWLQAVADPQVSVPVVSPFGYVAKYSLSLSSSDCRPLHLESPDQAITLAVVGQHGRQWTLNLRAPVVIRRDLRLGRQVIATEEHPLQHVLPRLGGSIRKCA
jgi:flagellar assembly factor FliW